MARKTKEEASRTRQQIIDAARQVFLERGVSRTTLEKVAQAAGVTRGAVYWHFANKAELFFAMKEQVSLPLIDRTDGFLLAEDLADPLDGVERSLKEFFRTLEECPEVRQTFDIMTLRCEYVDEFAPVLAALNKPAIDFVAKLEEAYRRAAEKGTLRPNLKPSDLALDTWAFVSGLIRQWLAGYSCETLRRMVPDMIAAHVELRRNPPCQSVRSSSCKP